MSDTIAVTSSAHDIGCVKWFNNKSGFGFITVSTGEHSGTDIFVHHTGIIVGNEQQYRYLVQGEYVELSIEASDNENYKFKAVNVSGISGGKLMCETRHVMKFHASSEIKKRVDEPREKFYENKRGGGPREKLQEVKRGGTEPCESTKGWSVVSKKNRQAQETTLER